MRFRLLGPLEVVDGDEPLRLGGLKQRALLARLLLEPGRTVALERLVDDLWGDAVPDSAQKMIHIHVSKLRRLLPAGLLVTRPPGYAIDAGPDSIDRFEFERAAAQGRAALAGGDPAAAAELLHGALALWRGEALAELGEPFAVTERRHLEELRLACLEDRIEADLQLGRHAALAGELAAEVARNPLRERLRAHSMLALYRAGRHADALAAYDEHRRMLAGELGLEPSARMRELQRLILNQDPSLEQVAAAGALAADALERGRAALAHGEWERAKAAFADVPPGPDAAAAHDGWAQAARFLGEGEACIDARARAFRAFRADGDDRAAARAGAWLAYDTVVFRGDTAVAQGWFGHARRLLEDAPPDAEERGWLAFLEGEVALVAANDAGGAGEYAERALAIGRAAGAMDLELLALSLRGLAAVARGDVADGMRELDQATAAAVGGDMSGAHFAGAVCCHMIYACERVHDVDRAAQWCDTVRGLTSRWDVPQLFGFCRSHYASVLIWRGDFEAAEAELAAASEAFARGAPALMFESVTRLAELRRRQSRLDEASDLCERIAWHPAAQLCLAEIALDRGDAGRARELVARHLRALGPGERLGRAGGVELALRAELAAGATDAAGALLAELEELMDEVATDPVRATALHARALVAAARGETATARHGLEDAIDLWSRLRAPYELGRGRIELAALALDAGRPEDAERELAAAADVLAPLGAEAELARVEGLRARVRSERPRSPAP